MTFVESLTQSLAGITVADQDKVMVELAHRYARALDADGDPIKLGPLLQSCLETLLMSPRARATVLKGGARDNRAVNKLDELRERRARRNGAEDLDSATS